MTQLPKIYILFFIAGLSVISHAEIDKRTPLEAFEGDTKGTLMICRLSLMIAEQTQKGIELGREVTKEDKDKGDYRACIHKGLSDVIPSYKKAAAKLSSKPKAQSALKTYYAAWISALKGIDPSIDERRITYSARQSATDQRLNELWASVEIESQ